MINKNLSILSKASTLDIKTDPYPHLIIKNALEQDLYEQLEREFPASDTVLNNRAKNDTWYDYPACLAVNNDVITPLWKEFLEYHTSQEFYQDILELFGDEIKKIYPELEENFSKPLLELTTSVRQVGAAQNKVNHETDLSLECQFYINYTEKARTIRGPHIDRPTELYAALLYFRDEDDDSVGSDLEICESKDPESLYPSASQINVDHLPMEIDRAKVNVVNAAKYEPNTLVLFINTKHSIHAVSTRTPTPIARRHINFTADLFGLGDVGLFEVLHKTDKKLKLWLGSKPVIWRLAKFIQN